MGHTKALAKASAYKPIRMPSASKAEVENDRVWWAISESRMSRAWPQCLRLMGIKLAASYFSISI
jgi:hypothetical protein